LLVSPPLEREGIPDEPPSHSCLYYFERSPSANVFGVCRKETRAITAHPGSKINNVAGECRDAAQKS
jgi:hypothetical protein